MRVAVCASITPRYVFSPCIASGKGRSSRSNRSGEACMPAMRSMTSVNGASTHRIGLVSDVRTLTKMSPTRAAVNVWSAM